MTAIPDDILAVAAVVTGDENLPLRDWQKHDAITAMCALGYSKTHIAWALCTTRATIENYGLIHDIPMHRDDQRPDWTAIRWVTHHGACMPLKGSDRVEAVRGLAAQGHYCEEISRRLQCGTAPIRTIAGQHGIDLPAAPPKAGGWYAGRREPSQQRLVAA